MASFTPRIGKATSDGELVTLKLHHGIRTQRVVTGTVRSFLQDGVRRWEISTTDPHYPAIGFLPENVLRRE